MSTMAFSMTEARDNRTSVSFFDVDVFRNKLETYMRKQSHEMCEVVNTKKRKFSERWSDMEKEEIELAEEYRDDLVFQFGKRQRGSNYYPIDDDEIEDEEVSPLALPSPVTVYGAGYGEEDEESAAGPSSPSYFYGRHESLTRRSQECSDPMSLAMRRQLSGYSEVSQSSTTTSPTPDSYFLPDMDDSWMSMSASPCPPLSRASLSSASSAFNSTPDTPTNYDNHYGAGDSETSTQVDASEDRDADTVEHSDALHAVTSFANAYESLDLDLDLDLTSMEPHERNLLAALAPERFEKAALIKRAFRRSEKLLDQFARDSRLVMDSDGAHASSKAHGVDVEMDDGEYDQVFGELMHVM